MPDLFRISAPVTQNEESFVKAASELLEYGGALSIITIEAENATDAWNKFKSQAPEILLDLQEQKTSLEAEGRANDFYSNRFPYDSTHVGSSQKIGDNLHYVGMKIKFVEKYITV